MDELLMMIGQFLVDTISFVFQLSKEELIFVGVLVFAIAVATADLAGRGK